MAALGLTQQLLLGNIAGSVEQGAQQHKAVSCQGSVGIAARDGVVREHEQRHRRQA